MFSSDQKLSPESFHRYLLVVFFERTNFFQPNEQYLPKFESSLEAQRAEKTLDNLRILGNMEILQKSQIWVETQPGAESPFQNLNFGSSSQKPRGSIYQVFLFLSSFTGFFYFVSNILSRIVRATKFMVLPCPSFFQALTF